MRKAFMCSLCHHGLLGGALYLDADSVTYRTQKLTVHEKYRNLVLPLGDISDVSWNWIVFPVATFTMTDGGRYRFVIFNRLRFEKWFAEFRALVALDE